MWRGSSKIVKSLIYPVQYDGDELDEREDERFYIPTLEFARHCEAPNIQHPLRSDWSSKKTRASYAGQFLTATATRLDFCPIACYIKRLMKHKSGWSTRHPKSPGMSRTLGPSTLRLLINDLMVDQTIDTPLFYYQVSEASACF